MWYNPLMWISRAPDVDSYRSILSSHCILPLHFFSNIALHKIKEHQRKDAIHTKRKKDQRQKKPAKYEDGTLQS